ncbi:MULTISPECIES: hypothetical protein [Pseudomonas]|uniref:Uncharacterized protein n=2 Tax=Pseudomonas TaxID=286 RepID=A0ACC9MYC1_9PSED|nr:MULTISPECIES: hypothetical protein [Pseudomonas]AGN82258.1 hypothetical protein L483_15020 [Pseudomonas putida H8234]MBP2092705.1 hypothetical protein [Pseudomonas sp. PvP088]MBP2226477.1 hypothetical protein [Pseudomonas putida]MCE1021115.1 hypothetical protein [Pseudomonas monteilii]MCE1038663.1 hypothetical protein [Pseudomonas monteilii]
MAINRCFSSKGQIMKLFYSDQISEPQGGHPYTALAAFIAGYHLISTVLGMLVGGPAGAALMSD